MKKFTALILCLPLVSCLKYEDPYAKKVEPMPTCLQAASFIAQIPDPLPNLSVNPIYLEVRSHWKTFDTDYALFRLYNTSKGIQAEILVNNARTFNKNMKCTQQISQSDFDALTQKLNQAKICKSISQPIESCSMAMITPSSLYLIDTNGPLTVNLHPYSYESTSSFCSSEEVEDLQMSVSNLFPSNLPNSNCVDVN